MIATDQLVLSGSMKGVPKRRAGTDDKPEYRCTIMHRRHWCSASSASWTSHRPQNRPY